MKTLAVIILILGIVFSLYSFVSAVMHWPVIYIFADTGPWLTSIGLILIFAELFRK